MSRRLSKVKKIVRFREFRESIAADNMRQRLSEVRRALHELDLAQSAVDEVEVWKARALAGGSVDIGLYGIALERMQETMECRDAAERDLSENRQRTEEAGNHWRDATSATRVARERGLEEGRLASGMWEKRMFDQLSDLLLSRQGGGRD